MAETKHNKHDKTSVTGPYAYRKALGDGLESVRRGELCADRFTIDVLSFGATTAEIMGKSREFYLAACAAFYDDAVRFAKTLDAKTKVDDGGN